MPPEINPEEQTLRERQARLAAALDEITHILNHMLMMAELSASELDVNRPLLQARLELLQKQIDRIADGL